MRILAPAIAFILFIPFYLHAQTNSSSPAQTPAAITFLGGDGSSYSEAIVITGAPNEEIGVPAEYKWLRAHFPGFGDYQQKCLERDGKRYDIFTWRTASGENKTIYFDISAFYGKP